MSAPVFTRNKRYIGPRGCQTPDDRTRMRKATRSPSPAPEMRTCILRHYEQRLREKIEFSCSLRSNISNLARIALFFFFAVLSRYSFILFFYLVSFFDVGLHTFRIYATGPVCVFASSVSLRILCLRLPSHVTGNDIPLLS